MQIAKDRLEKTEQKQQELNIRATKFKQLEEKISAHAYADIIRDPRRVVEGTKASEAQRMTKEHLDEVTARRQSVGAHSKPIAMTARDLRSGMRATPAWCKGMV